MESRSLEVALAIALFVVQVSAGSCEPRSRPERSPGPDVLKFSVECARPAEDDEAQASERVASAIEPKRLHKKEPPKLDLSKVELPKLDLSKLVKKPYKKYANLPELGKAIFPSSEPLSELAAKSRKLIKSKKDSLLSGESKVYKSEVPAETKEIPSLFKRALVKKDLEPQESIASHKEELPPKRFEAKTAPSLSELLRSKQPLEEPGDYTINQEDLNRKSCEICDCLLKAFPKKVEHGRFVIQASEPKNTIPSLKKILQLPKYESKFRKSKPKGSLYKDHDQSVMADELKPTYALPPAKYDASEDGYKVQPEDYDKNKFGIPSYEDNKVEGTEEGSSVSEKAEKLEEGIQKLIEFVNLVDQIDEYISEKTRHVITRLSKLYEY